MISILLLKLLRVDDATILEDHGLSRERALSPMARELQIPDEFTACDEACAAEGTSYNDALSDFATDLDAAAELRAAGLRDDEMKRLRQQFAHST